MEQIVGALLPLFAVFVVVANPAPVWWGEISSLYLYQDGDLHLSGAQIYCS